MGIASFRNRCSNNQVIDADMQDLYKQIPHQHLKDYNHVPHIPNPCNRNTNAIPTEANLREDAQGTLQSPMERGVCTFMLLYSGHNFLLLLKLVVSAFGTLRTQLIKSQNRMFLFFSAAII
jgi:hypothetical protein